MEVDPVVRVKLEPTIVRGSMASLKVAVWELEMTTAVAEFAGTVEVTVGAVVSGAGAVVKLQTLLAAKEFPARSFAPVVTVAV